MQSKNTADIGLDWDLKIDDFYLLDHSQHKHSNNHQHFKYRDELISTTVVGSIKKGKESDCRSISMNNRSPALPLLIFKHTCLLEYQCQLQKQSKDKSETSTVSIFKKEDE